MEKANRYYTEEFKRQIVGLRGSGKSVGELHREYKISKTAIRNWEREMGNSGKLGVAETISETERELRLLRKENKQLRMDVDILKQAAVILGRADV